MGRSATKQLFRHAGRFREALQQPQVRSMLAEHAPLVQLFSEQREAGSRLDRTIERATLILLETAAQLLQLRLVPPQVACHLNERGELVLQHAAELVVQRLLAI